MPLLSSSDNVLLVLVVAKSHTQTAIHSACAECMCPWNVVGGSENAVFGSRGNETERGHTLSVHIGVRMVEGSTPSTPE